MTADGRSHRFFSGNIVVDRDCLISEKVQKGQKGAKRSKRYKKVKKVQKGAKRCKKVQKGAFFFKSD